MVGRRRTGPSDRATWLAVQSEISLLRSQQPCLSERQAEKAATSTVWTQHKANWLALFVCVEVMGGLFRRLHVVAPKVGQNKH